MYSMVREDWKVDYDVDRASQLVIKFVIQVVAGIEIDNW